MYLEEKSMGNSLTAFSNQGQPNRQKAFITVLLDTIKLQYFACAFGNLQVVIADCNN